MVERGLKRGITVVSLLGRKWRKSKVSVMDCNKQFLQQPHEIQFGAFIGSSSPVHDFRCLFSNVGHLCIYILILLLLFVAGNSFGVEFNRRGEQLGITISGKSDSVKLKNKNIENPFWYLFQAGVLFYADKQRP